MFVHIYRIIDITVVNYCLNNKKYTTGIFLISENLLSYALASEMSLTAAASTIFLMTNFFIALSLGTARAQLVHLINLTCPLPFFERPLLRLLEV